MPMKLTQSLVPVVRRKMLANQGGLCLLCKTECSDEQAVLDHDHGNGHVRGVLHRGCNALLGVIENNRPRNQLMDDDQFIRFLNNIPAYITANVEANPIYPSHKNAEEKKIAAANRRRKKALAEKIAANPEQAEKIKAHAAKLKKARADRNRPKMKRASDDDTE